MNRIHLLAFALLLGTPALAQRYVDRLDRGLIAQKTTQGVFLSWRIQGEEYYDVQYNVYRDGVKITDTPLNVSNYTDKSGDTSCTYTVTAVVRGTEQEQSKAAKVWSKSYMEIVPQHDPGLQSTYIPNDACCADVDGDGEMEILLKYDNQSEIAASYPRDGYNGEYSLFECLKLDGTVLWWVNCGPNMGDFQNNEQNIVAYDWDGDGRAEAVFRAADGTTIHTADGSVYTVGDKSKNYRAATGGGTNWFMHDGDEYLVYADGATGKPYQCITYPLLRLEPGETDLNAAWGDGYGHRSSKYFFGAPYLDGRHPSIFLARGIYTRHKMIAYDVEPETHKLVQRWKWYNNTSGYWKGQGYHNYCVADVDWDGRDEIVFGSMVIDDNGKGLSSTGLGHGDALHCGDFNPYTHGQEIYACNEDRPGNNYRDATTSKIYHRFESGNDDGRSMAGNFCNSYPGGQGCSAREGLISLVYNDAVPGMDAGGVNTNFRIYWDGDLLEETFNYVNGKNTEGCVAKYGSWTPIYTCEGSMTNNDTKGTPCYQGDIFGDWREEIIMRTAQNNIRIYSTPTPTKWRNYTLWHDHQYRNAMVWQMCGYNQPPHASYYLGELERITVAPPPFTMTGRVEVADGGTIGSSLDGEHVIVCETANSSVSIADGAAPYILTFNVPTWVQGSAASEYSAKEATIKYDTFTCNVTGGAITGEARLVKQGDGILCLPKVDMTHSGATSIWAGTVNFDGTMRQSDVWLNRFAELNSNGGTFKSLTADYASVFRPAGTVTVDGQLALGFGSRMVMSLGSVVKAGSVKIEKKTGDAWTKYGPEYIQPVLQIEGDNLEAGDYVIIETDSVEGDVADFKVEGVETLKPSLRYDNGKVVLTLGDTRGPSSIYWTGASGNVWDFANTENFVLADDEEAGAQTFVKGDKVFFGDNASTFTVNISEPLAADAITVDNTRDYIFQGEGSITAGSLTKSGSGRLTVRTLNSYTGGNHLMGGTVAVSALSNDVNAEGNLGGVTSSAALFTMENGAVLLASAEVKNGSPIKMAGEDGGVINNAADFVQQASFSGTVLTKRGTGWLKTGATGASLARLVIAAGTVQNGSGIAAKVVELQGGSLVDNVGTNNEICIPAKKTGSWSPANRQDYSNKLTGEGKITVYSAAEKGSNYYATRTPLKLNLSAFEGTLTAGAAYTADGRFTLDTSNGGDKWTLDIPAGIIVQNSGKTLKVGALTGSGTLGGFCAFRNGVAEAANTWTVGNDANTSFSGKITGKDNFNKVGAGTLSLSGLSDFTGTASINAGTLKLNKSNAASGMLGTGALSVKALLTGVGTLSNKSVAIASGGTLRPGLTETALSGEIKLGGANLTVNSGAAMQFCVNTKTRATKLTGIGKLTLNGTLRVIAGNSFNLSEGDEVQLFEADECTIGTAAVIELPDSYRWDTSRLAEGILVYAGVADAILSAEADAEGSAYDLQGRPAANPRRGLYIINGQKIVKK